MQQLYNIYITTGGESEGYLGANGRHAQGMQRAHLWIHNGEIKKNHSLEDIYIDVNKIIDLYGVGYHKNKTLEKLEALEVYIEIQRLNALDPVDAELRLCKLGEEKGELFQAVNKKLGRKVVKETDEEVLDLICEEAADTIQCILSFMDFFDIDFDDIENLFYDGANKEDISTAKVLLKLEKHVGCLAYQLEHEGEPKLETIRKSISKAFIVASHYGIKESEILARMPEKNAKWEKITNDRLNKQ